MSHRSRLFFQIGCWAALGTSVVHMIGTLSGRPAPTNDIERSFFHLLETYRFALPGAARTFAELTQGFSLTFSLFLALTGATGLSVVRRASTDAMLVPALARMNAVAFVVLLVISLTYWFLVPTLCIAVSAAAFIIASLSGRAGDTPPGAPR